MMFLSSFCNNVVSERLRWSQVVSINRSVRFMQCLRCLRSNCSLRLSCLQWRARSAYISWGDVWNPTQAHTHHWGSHKHATGCTLPHCRDMTLPTRTFPHPGGRLCIPACSFPACSSDLFSFFVCFLRESHHLCPPPMCEVTSSQIKKVGVCM